MRHVFLIILLFTNISCSFFKQNQQNTKTVNGMQFASVTLPNKLEVLVVHDSRFKKSSAAMAVMVGSMEDPLNAQGMAHYLEHMLFLGTKEFPEPSEYSTFMETNGGWDNAYTSDEVTNFMFEIDNAAMEGALHRFSRFFVEPLFDDKYLEREKNAVNSEFEKNIKSDGWRLDRFINTLAKQDHPYGKFSTGSTKTLSDVKRGDVISFYRKYYSSNNMKLVIMSAQPLDQLMDWTHKYFTDVPNFGSQRPQYADDFFDANTKNRLHFVKSIQDSEDMTVLFNIPNDKSYWESKPTLILSDILGHEGKGSLLSYLKGQGWALRLTAGPSVWRTFGIDITLTPSGRAHYEQVLGAIFQYIELVKQKGYPEEIFKEQKALRKIDLDNLEPSASGNRAADFASQMTDYPVDNFLERSYLLEKYSVDDFKKFLSYLNKDNVHAIISSKNEKVSQKEDIFGVEFLSQPLSVKESSPAPLFMYPEKNEYVPTDFSLYSKNSLGEPKKIEVKDKGEIFFQQDTDLGLAVGHMQINFLSDIPNTPMNDLLNSLFERGKVEELREWAYPITQARYNFYIQSRNGDEINLNVSGYTQRLGKVAKDFIFDKENNRKLSELKIDEKTFKDVKDKYKKDLQNVEDMVAIQRLGFEWQTLSDTKALRWQDTLALVDKVTLKDVQDFGKKFFTKVHLRAVAYGNVKEEDYKDLIESTFTDLGSTPLASDVAAKKRSEFRILPDGKKYSMLVKGKNNNHAMMTFYKLADWSLESQAKTLVLDQILSQPYFAELRTNQQLGYVARGSGSWNNGFIGLMGMLQSGKYASNDLMEKSDKFINEFLKTQSEKTTDEELKPVKSSLVNEMLTKPNTLGERYEQFKNTAIKYQGHFDVRRELAEKIKQTTAEDYKKFIKSNFFDKTPSTLTLYYVGESSKMTKKDLSGVVFEKTEDVKDWILADPYKDK